MEPRFSRVAILLGGGGLVDAFYDHPQAAPYRKLWELLGGTKEQVKQAIAPVDPITWPANLKGRQVLMIAAKRDEIVPPSAARHCGRRWASRRSSGTIRRITAPHFTSPRRSKPVIEHFGAE